IASEWLVVAVQVRHIGERSRQPVVRGGAQRIAHRVFQWAERAGEGEVLLVRERLVMEDQYRVTVHPVMDLIHLRWRQGLADVDALDLGADVGRYRTELDGHGGELRGASLSTACPPAPACDTAGDAGSDRSRARPCAATGGRRVSGDRPAGTDARSRTAAASPCRSGPAESPASPRESSR